MLTVALSGLVFVGITIAEKKKWLDPERVKTIINIGMAAGIAGFALYFIHMLKHFL
ncbi:hypothetical protein CPT_Pascal24 [Bacillus phage Pascal]|uniref:Uncharacterized protein n=1 Tax=Bacillus phage Pascal TaxID=1540092 RepID=A0A0A0RPU8_9CAUD|nr:hypothetical protein CPT_Pascal24 [Bacillus phage Pascal]AIW03659.1 hypothetical protein CPT_Pascal24 [Bacillus phage Pascal]